MFLIAITSSLIAALILGLATATTGTVGAISSARATREANQANIDFQREANAAEMAFNSAEAEKQRQWETEMSNTQVQRAMADYQAAGLNPLMAIPNGASYGAGTSASASLGSPKVSPVSGFAEAMNSLSSASMSMANLLLISKMVDNKISAKDIAGLKSGTSSSKVTASELRKLGWSVL